MSVDDFMVAIIVGGIGLTGAYFRAEYLSWRKHKATERKVTSRQGGNQAKVAQAGVE